MKEERFRSSCSVVAFAVVMILLFCMASTPAAAQNPAQVGQWAAPMKWPVEAIHMNLLPNGTVMFWGDYNTSEIPYIWDPIANTITPAAAFTYPLFCSGHVLMANGQLMVLGGLNLGAGFSGIPDARVYDYTTNTWSADGIVPDMNDGRYYPTATALPNGNVLIMSGDAEKSVNTLPQIWQSSLPGCSTSPIPTSPLPGTCWINLTGANLALQLYPKNFVAPNGEVFNAGPTPVTKYLNTTGIGAWTTVGATVNKIVRDYGPAVMYDSGKIMIAGGARPPSATAETIDLNQTKPAWVSTGSMNFARRQNNATILADGTVLVTGGGGGTTTAFDDFNNPVFAAELWNPTTGTWTVQASENRYRGYHSGALLLPDGRVLVAGGDYSCVTSATVLPFTGHCSFLTPPTAEVFSPAYLFQGPQPTITSAPTNVTYGQSFFVQTPNAANITQVTWIRLSTVTHTFNESQRNNYLSFTQDPGGQGLDVTSPANSNLAPPGHYMLFILQNGVPSVAAIIQIQ